MQKSLLATLTLLGIFTVSGCATQPASKPAAAPDGQKAATATAQEQRESNLFIVLNEDLGRYYLFGDPALYRLYLETGEVPMTHAFIGEGPEGTSLIFGITKEDAKRGGPSMAERLYRGQVVPSGPFYGEVFKDGRYYVFFTWPDMADYLKHGEVPLTYTEIGVGPAGETVIYALNKETAKRGRPEAAIKRFHELHPKQTTAAQHN